MLIQSILYSNVIEIDVDEPYANGEMWLSNISEGLGGMHIWSDDTIVFSNGTMLAPMDFYVLHRPTSATLRSLCFVIVDTVSSPFFKYSNDIYKDYSLYNFQNPDPDTQCCHSGRLFDTLWNEAMQFPDSCAGFDSVMIFEGDLPDTLIPIGYSWSRSFFGKSYPSFYVHNFGPSDSYSAIFYIKTENSTHLKLQVDDYTIDSSTTSMWGKNKHLGNYHFRWAADSSGNGVFKHDQVNITKPYSKSKKNCIGKMIRNTFHFNRAITKAEITIFSLRGSCVQQDIVTGQRVFVPKYLPPGLYCMQIIGNNNTSIVPIVIK